MHKSKTSVKLFKYNPFDFIEVNYRLYKIKLTIIILFLCLVLGGFLRLWNLDINPPGVHADEADSGYNAYSILKTGRDFYGNFFPIQITGFAENYRTPLTTYLTIPFIAVFGPSPFVIRLPAALLGTLFIFIMYKLSKNIFKSESTALLCAFITSVNPWAVHISRAYADHILALVFVSASFVLLFGIRTLLSMGFAGLFLGLSFFSYHAPKIFVPLFFPILIFYFGRKVLNEKLNFSIVFFIFSLLFGLVIFVSLLHEGAREFEIVSIFDNSRAVKQIDKERTVTIAPLWASSIFHNKPLYYGKEILRGVGRSLSFNYLFLDGESNLTAWIGDRGLFYLIEFPLFLIGIFFLFQKNKKLGLLLLGWIIISTIPGAITTNQMYTYRNIYLLPPMLLIISYGILKVISNILGKRNRLFFIFLLSILYVWLSFAYYFHYFFDFPVYSRAWWAADQHDAIVYALQNQVKYDYIYVNGGTDWPLLYAFYNRTDPFVFQRAIRNYKVQKGKKFITIDKFKFGKVKTAGYTLASEVFSKNTLYIGYVEDFPKSKVLHQILSKDDWGTVFKFIEVK